MESSYTKLIQVGFKIWIVGNTHPDPILPTSSWYTPGSRNGMEQGNGMGGGVQDKGQTGVKIINKDPLRNGRLGIQNSKEKDREISGRSN